MERDVNSHGRVPQSIVDPESTPGLGTDLYETPLIATEMSRTRVCVLFYADRHRLWRAIRTNRCARMSGSWENSWVTHCATTRARGCSRASSACERAPR